MLKDNIKNKIRLVGKVGGYWITLEKYSSGDLSERLKDGLAVLAIFAGIGLFYFILP